MFNPNPVPLPNGLVEKKRLSQHRQFMLGNANSLVVKDDTHTRALTDRQGLTRDFKAFVFVSFQIFFIQGIPRIVDDVDENLLNLMKICFDRGEVIIQAYFEGDALFADLRLGKNNGFGENIGNAGTSFFLASVLLRKGKQGFDDPSDTLSFLDNARANVLLHALRTAFVEQYLAVVDNTGNGVVDFMCHASC